MAPTPPSSSSAPDEPPAAHPTAPAPQTRSPTDRLWLHLLLFVLAFGSTVYVGAGWVGRALYYESQSEPVSLLFATVPEAWLLDGLRYAIPLLGFLTVHEFGHYFTARHHRVNTSLPYYIPCPLPGTIGNFGAVISIRQAIPSTRVLFDIGVAGPLAGFVVALGALLYAFATLPPPEYLLDLPGHEALKAHIRQYGTFPDTPPTPEEGTLVLVVGQTPLYWFLSQFFAHVPPMYEMYHYPVLFAGWLGLFFTALNLLPLGQLDGGHVLYALFGRTWHRRLAYGFLLLLLWSGGIGFMQEVRPALSGMGSPWGALSWGLLALLFYGYLYRPFRGKHRRIALGAGGLLLSVAVSMAVGAPFTDYGYTGWFVWTLLIIFFVRVEHPPVAQPEALTPTRRALGYLAIAIFVLCFSLRPLTLL